jgi:hypothetical protein
MKHLSIKITVDAFEGLTPTEREKLFREERHKPILITKTKQDGSATDTKK